MEFVLHALVGRDGRGHPPLHRPRELRRGLLAERACQRARPLQVAALRRVGAGHQPDGEPADERVDARLQHRHPQRHRHHDRRRGAPHGQVAQRQQQEEQRDRDHERHAGHVAGVDDRDHPERREVVEHRERQQEHAHPGGGAGGEQRQHAEREGGVGRHRRPPPVPAGAPGVEREVDRDRDQDAADGGRRREHDPPALPQLPEVELALGLEPHHQEEQRHQPLVDPVAQVERHAGAADVDRHHGRPGGLVGARREVGPQQRHDRRPEHQRRPAGFGVQEVPHGGREVPPPGGLLRERERAPGRAHDDAVLDERRLDRPMGTLFSGLLRSARSRRPGHAPEAVGRQRSPCLGQSALEFVRRF